MVIELLIGVITALLLYYVVFSTRKPRNFPPGPPWLPFLGSSVVVKRLARSLGGQQKAFGKLSEIYNSDVIGLKLGKEQIIVVQSYETVKKILTGDEYIGRPDNYFWRLRCMGKISGITSTDGETWRQQRHFVTTHLRNLGFGKSPMERMIRDEVDDLLDYFKKTEEVNISNVLSTSVLSVLWSLVSGYRLDRSDSRLLRLLDILDARGRAFDMSGGTLNQFPWLRFVAPEKTGFNIIQNLNSEMKKLLIEIITQHKSISKDDRSDDLVYSYIRQMKEEDNTFTEEHLMMVIVDIFIAGAQSTSNTLTFAIMVMIMYPDLQKKVKRSLEDAFTWTEKISYSERSRIPYVEAVLCEVERYYNIIPIGGPRRVLRDTTLNNYFIPQNTTVLINLHSVHHDKDYWGDPEIFRPERFLDSNGKLMYHDRLIPFGLGKYPKPLRCTRRHFLL
nr:cytochrome P450 [Agasicles hygrophila]